ncbi:L,D-transpeptidase family protein [Novosphingobium flavum]|uniref:L,D-transpeptidase family protein n=1 Tax=Novosphingobium flavum TaxID=1778672 RepID=A0A7X1FRL0_9SPHN|nr:L,D-transpeptidase family protein [Novosphingobium flavum]MBC2665673.1 L,D-transpeptidase family protein [Novosphingobium flavum]
MRRLLLTGMLAALLTAPAAAAHAEPGEVARVLVEKGARRLTLFDEADRPLRVITGLQLGFAPTGPKRQQGDGRTPEGRYTIDYGNEASGYHLSLHISYPAPADRARAAATGRSPGGDIFIHGQPNSLRNGRISGDWTAGCIAVSNEEIEQLWALVPDGTPIDLLP